jgi:four helix bundle protein
MVKFRFEDLEIWQISISTPNNIAEGSGSDSKKDFANFLNMAKRSIFENANMVIILQHRKLITPEIERELLEELDKLSRKITSFKNSLK